MTERTRAIDELADLLGPAVRAIVRTRAQIVLGVAVAITLLCAFALAGAAIDDRRISEHPGVAQAEVLDGSTVLRTLVRFTVAGGELVVPELGVAYPRGLAPGTTVTVEYDVTDPDFVRVAGRTAFGSAAPLLAAVAVTWAGLWPLSRRLRRRAAGAAATAAG